MTLHFTMNLVVYRNLALSSVYLLLNIGTLLQILQMCYYRHKTLSFRMGFLLHCFVWSSLRAMFFAIRIYIDSIYPLVYLLWWFPFCVQFSTFSFLVMYYAQMHHTQKSDWTNLRKIYLILWVITNIMTLSELIVWLTLTSFYLYADPTTNIKHLLYIQQVLSGVEFLILTIVLVFYGTRIVIQTWNFTGLQTKFTLAFPWIKVVVVTVILFCTFTSRSVYDFVVVFNGDLQLQMESNNIVQLILVFAVMCFWEILPFCR